MPSPDGQPRQGQPQPGQQHGNVNGRMVLAVLAALLVVVGGLIAAAVLLSGDDDSDSDGSADPDGPVAVVEATLAAIEDGDCDAAREHAPELGEHTCAELRPDGVSPTAR